MTLSTTLDRQYFDADGVNQNFPFNFKFLENSNIFVWLIGPDGTQTPQLITTNYTLVGAMSETGGTVTMLVAPPLTVPATQVFVQRIVPQTQPTSIRNQGKFFPELHENAFDRLTMLIQQTSGAISRFLGIPTSDPDTAITVIPNYMVRAEKLLAFDASGDPIVSNLTLDELEAQPAGAAASAAAAAASAGAAAGSAGAASASAGAAAGSASAAAASAASVTGAAVPLFSVMWWPGLRAAVPAGYVVADGQTLSRALYPDAWTAINAGNMPTVADATWLVDPTQRGKYTAGNGTTTFRVADYNGVSGGTIGAPFLRGDGQLTAGVAGTIRPDQFQGHKFQVTLLSTASAGAGSQGGNAGSMVVTTGDPITNGVHGTPRFGSETRPVDICGCFVIKLFGAVTNQGAADAALLATELANLNAAFQGSRAGSFANTYILLEDRKATNTAGGTANASVWQTRDITNLAKNGIAGASLASNQITLPAGTYRYDISAPAAACGGHQTRLRNMTAAADIGYGTSEFSTTAAVNATTRSFLKGEFTIAVTSVIEVQHNVQTTRATNGLGIVANLGTTELYTQGEIWRLQ